MENIEDVSQKLQFIKQKCRRYTIPTDKPHLTNILKLTSSEQNLE